MAVAARRGHPQCKACTLPVSVRAEIAKRALRGDSLRSISAYVVNEGHALGKDGIAHHLRQCVGIGDKGGASDLATRSLMTAALVGYVLHGFPRLSNDIAEELIGADLSDEAEAVQLHLPEYQRRALEAAAGTPTGELLAARALALACSRVLSTGHEATARALADDLHEQGADELASSLLVLADRAQRVTTDRQSEGSAAGSAPSAAFNHKESA